MDVERPYVASHGQSAVAVAVCHVLGFQLLPRLQASHKQRLYRPAAGYPEAYPHLQPILRRPLNWHLIAPESDNLIKYRIALRLGTADTDAILRRFTRHNVQQPTSTALLALGQARRTLFLCRYLRRRELRREGCDRSRSEVSCRQRQLDHLERFARFDQRAIRVQPLGFLLDAIPHEVVPIPIEVGAAHVQHRLRTLDRPAHARALHPVFNKMATGSLDHSGSNRVARGEIHIVMHPMGIVFKVATDFGQLVPLLASQLAFGAHLPKPGHYRRHLAFEQAQDPVVHKAQGLLLIATVEQMRGVPYPWGGMQQVKNLDGRDLWQHALAGVP